MKNHLHPKKNLIFALNFGGSQRQSSHALKWAYMICIGDKPYMAYACPLESVLYTCILKAINRLR